MLLHGVCGPGVDQLIKHFIQHFPNLSVFGGELSQQNGNQLVMVRVLYDETDCNYTRRCHDLKIRVNVSNFVSGIDQHEANCKYYTQNGT